MITAHKCYHTIYPKSSSESRFNRDFWKLGYFNFIMAFPGGSVVKNLPANAGDVGLIPGSERSPGEGNSNLF